MALNDHPDLPNDQLHKPLDFATAVLSSNIEKDAHGNYVWSFKHWQSPVTAIAPIDEAPPAESGRYILVLGDTNDIHEQWGVDVTINDIVEYNIDADSTADEWSAVEPDEGMFTWVDEIDVLMVFDGTKWKAQSSKAIYSTSTDVATTGASEETLASYTLPAYMLLNDEEAITVKADIQFAANANNKTIKVKFGSDTVTINPSSDNDRAVSVEVKYIRTSISTQKIIIRETDSQHDSSGAVEGYAAFDTAAEDLGADVSISITGQGTAASDLTLKHFSVIFNSY